MNWQIGLRRISVVFWCVLAIYPVAIIAVDISKGHPLLPWLGLLALTVCVFYALHRLTCWVIDGFTVKR